MFFFRRQIDAPFSQDLMDRLFDCDRPEGFGLAEIVDAQDINYNNVIARNKMTKQSRKRQETKTTKRVKQLIQNNNSD